MAILDLARGLVETSQSSARVEIGDSATFDEDFLNIASGEQVGERTELRDRPHHSIDHLRWVVQGSALTEMGATLVLVD